MRSCNVRIRMIVLKRFSILSAALLLSALFQAGAADSCLALREGDLVFDRTGSNLTVPFKTFMKANEDTFAGMLRRFVPGARQYVFDNETALSLQKYHFILIPGGEFDAASELMRYCTDGSFSPPVQEFFERNPTTQADVEKYLRENICQKPDTLNTLYNTYLGTFKTHERFFTEQGLAFTRLDYFTAGGPSYIGDRIGKLDLIAQTIDDLEARGDAAARDGYVLIGHSYGGLNICDFLVELAGGHVPGTPEWKYFALTKVRSWPAEKKDRLFNKIKAAVLLNTFLQGNYTSERRLIQAMQDNGTADADPIEQEIQAVLAKSANDSVSTEEFIADARIHLALLTVKYRRSYYLTDQNQPASGGVAGIRATFEKIADSMPVITAGCSVPRFAQYLRAGFNFMVLNSTSKWQAENASNDGQVNTYGGIFPAASAEHIIFNCMDHGTLVMKPDIPWLTSGSRYDQLPFIKTLLKHVDTRLRTAAGR